MNTIKKILLIVSVVLCCVGCDQLTKEIAKQNLKGKDILSWGQNIFRLQYAENPGAWLSLGAAWPNSVRFWVFIVLPAAVLCGLMFTGAFTNKLSRSHLELLALSLLVGGGWGNLLDRIGREGHVVDFLNLGIGSLRTGIFNVADVLIMIGVGGLLLFQLTVLPPSSAEMADSTRD